MTSLPPPDRQNAGIAKRETSSLHVVYKIYRYDVTTFPGRQNAGIAKCETFFPLGIYEIHQYDVTTFS